MRNRLRCMYYSTDKIAFTFNMKWHLINYIKNSLLNGDKKLFHYNHLSLIAPMSYWLTVVSDCFVQTSTLLDIMSHAWLVSKLGEDIYRFFTLFWRRKKNIITFSSRNTYVIFITIAFCSKKPKNIYVSVLKVDISFVALIFGNGIEYKLHLQRGLIIF